MAHTRKAVGRLSEGNESGTRVTESFLLRLFAEVSGCQSGRHEKVFKGLRQKAQNDRGIGR